MLPDRTVKGDVLVRAGRERREAQALVDAFRIKAAGVEIPPDALSGGNQQKIVVAKWLATSPKVLLLDEPTKGVDVGAKFEIHEIIRREAARGAGCLVASSDLPEVLALADRILVMREGRHPGTDRRGRRDRGIRDAPGDPRGVGLKKLWEIRELSTVAILVFEILFFTWYLWPDGNRSHPFLNAGNGLLILKYSAIYGIAAVGAAMVIISGGVDLVAGRGDGARRRRRRATVRRPGLVARAGHDPRRPRRAGGRLRQRGARRGSSSCPRSSRRSG